jgi:biopolymer transport protein ExbB
MNSFALAFPRFAVQSNAEPRLDSLWDTLVSGGPVMIPLAVCSVLALMWTLERFLRLRSQRVGSRAHAEQLVAAARDLGPARAFEHARAQATVLSQIFRPVFERWSEPRSALEKSVEETASREVRAQISSLRPLSVITALAPLLGLLGTVVGIIIAFRDIGQANAMGKPEALATGIAQALVTTAAGLSIAIPTQAAYYWLRNRIDRYTRLVEETGEQILAVHAGRPPAPISSAPVLPMTPKPTEAPHGVVPAVSVAAQGTP